MLASCSLPRLLIWCPTLSPSQESGFLALALGWDGLGWTGLGWAGLGWAGLGWGWGWVELGCGPRLWARAGWDSHCPGSIPTVQSITRRRHTRPMQS